MSVLYHLMIPRPKTPGLDAVVQEAEALRSHVGGEIVYLNPARRPGSRYPERLYGLHRLPLLRRREATTHIHHIFNAHLLVFPYLRWLRRPIVYTITAGIARSKQAVDLKTVAGWAAVVVSSERDRATLKSWGLDNVHIIRPGIDTSRFVPTPPPTDLGFTLLAGSAPWSEAQFHSKGVDALLEAAQRRPDLHLVFLWRGTLAEQMSERVTQYNLQERVQVINERVDVNHVLSGVHAAVVLATDATLVKAYPHSLLEALVAGRPVLVSDVLPMADFVETTGCGEVVVSVSASGVLEAVARLQRRYESCRVAALQAGQHGFDLDTLIAAYRRLYSDAAGLTLTRT
jgi:glycosyltransferase involved in cell wall biosynthesis